MSDIFQSDQRDDHTWAVAEQWFMRFMGGSLLTIAIVSMIFGVFPTGLNTRFVTGMNISITLVLGIGSLWSLYWSSDIERLYKLIDGFKERGTTATYLSAVMQIFVGILFGLEFMEGNYALGLAGTLMLIAAVFFIWRAQQIKHYTRI